MIRLFPTLIFLSIYLNLNAQCIILQNGSACLNSDGETSLNFIAGNDCGNTNLSDWIVTSADGSSEGVVTQGVPPLMSFYNVLINQEGTYLISDGGSEFIEFIIYPKPTFTSTVSSQYFLCDDSVNIQFEILPAENFHNFSWIGSATESNNVNNGQFGSEYANTFSGTYFNSGEYALNAQFNDIVSGCLVRTQDDVTQNININILEGPSTENLVISYPDTLSNLACINIGSIYDLSFDQSYPISATISPSKFTVNTTNNSNILSENFVIPVTLEYDSIGCLISTEINHSHGVISNPSFSTLGFDGNLCNNQVISLTNSSSHYSNQNTGDFQWNIEGAENIEENGPNITFTYPEDGSYLWTLTYTNPSGECTSSDSLIQDVNVDYITSDFTVDNQTICDSEGTISLESTSLVDTDGTFTYSWTVGESSLGEVDLSSSITHTLSSPGTYDVGLTVINTESGCSASKLEEDFITVVGSTVFTINNFDGNLCNNQVISLTNSSSHYSNQNTGDFQWNIEGAENIEENGSDITFTYPEDGSYLWSLTYTDPIGGCVVNFDTLVYVNVDYITSDFTVDNQTICDSEGTISLESTSLVDTDGTFTYSWTVGESSLGEVDLSSSITHTLSSPGTYDVGLTVINTESGCSASKLEEDFITVVGSTVFTINNFDGNLCNNQVISLTNSSSHYSNQNTGDFQWNIEGAENIEENGSDITFTYPEDGSYLWSLTYTDPIGGCVVNFDTLVYVNVDYITSDFTVDNQTICDSEGTISLESTSLVDTDGTFTYSWTVGESSLGEVDLSSSITHTLSSPGTYDVGLTVINTESGCSASKLEEDFITVVGSTVFTINNFDGNLCNNQVISLTNSSSHYSNQNTGDFQWNIEGAENIEENGSDITFTYSEDGSYLWSLTYTDPIGGCVVNFDTLVYVNVDYITSDFTVDNQTICDSEGTISLESTSLVDTDGTFTYSWTVGESSLGEVDLSSSITHTLSSPGTYDVGLTVINTESGCSASKLEEDFITVVGSTVFTINNFDGNLCNNQVISLTNSSSHYSNQNTGDFQWNIEGAENIEENGSDITFTYPEDGSYLWTLTYTDPIGGCVVNFDTLVYVNVDYITSDFTVDNQTICDSEGTISLESTSLVDTDGTFTYSWTVGESSLGEVDLSSSITHTLSSPGTYDVGLTVINTESGCSASKLEEDFITVVGSTVFTINNFDGNLCNNQVISLTNSSSHYSNQNTGDFQWNIEGAENIEENGSDITFTYPEDGSYLWSLTYTDPIGGCVVNFDTLVYVNVDLIEPLLSDDLTELSCLSETSLNLSHQTLLDELSEEYVFTWSLIPDNELFATFDSQLIGESVTFDIISNQPQSFSASLNIQNITSECSGYAVFEDIYRISDVSSTISTNSSQTCLPNLVDLSTENVDIIDVYQWNIFSSDGSIINGPNEHTFNINLESGIYDVQLVTETNDGC